MIVFEQEKVDGLTDLIIASQTEKLTVPVFLKPKDSKLITAAVINEPGLFTYDSILVTAGEPNGNDIFFAPEDVFAAKDTPINKQINLNHTDDIVGHMVASYIVDDDYEPMEVDPEDLPEYFHILVESVLYTEWKDEDREKQIAKLTEEIAAGEWSVSMECLSPNFDYLFIDSEGSRSIVKRSEETAYLSKHLKRFKGSGEFNGKRIYCVPRELWFSGKGLTTNPANPKSKIVAQKNEDVYLDLDENINSFENNLGENNMTEDQIKQAIKDALSAHFATATVGTTELKPGFDFAAAFEALTKAFASVNEKVDSFIANYNEKVGKLEADVTAKDEQITSLTASLETVTKEKDATVTELKAEKDEKASIVRLAKLIQAGLDETAAKAVVDSTLALSDEQFEIVASKVSPVAASKTEPVSDVKVLEDVKPDPEPAPIVASKDETSSIASDFAAFYASGTKKGK